MHALKSFAVLPLLLLMACNPTSGNGQPHSSAPQDLTEYSTAYFASGCFWCVEAIFQSVEGVAVAISGTNGGKDRPRIVVDESLPVATFAGGCFWCVESGFEHVPGVVEAVSGYTGGPEKNPTYRQVSSGATGHAEAVEVYYDPEVVSYATLLKVFFGSHDPTTLNRQGPDRGAQYRSGIYYQTEAEKAAIEAYIQELVAEGVYTREEITTEVAELTKFWPAEDYHQEYEANHPNQPYVRSVSIPRLNRFKAQYPELLKEEAKQAH